MQASDGRVIAASALPEEAAALCGMLRRTGFSEIICVSDGLSVIRQAQSAPVDLVVADAVLPVLDGIAMAERLRNAPLNVHPAVILLSMKGICPGNADCVLEKPIRADVLADAVADLAPEKRTVPEGKRLLALGTLERLGVPEHIGRDCLMRAAELVWLDSRLLGRLTARLYPAVAETFGTDSRHVQRAMRHVIDEAWRSGAMEAQNELFGDTIDAGRGSPTLGEMIARIADILRWEGKA